MAKHKVEGFSSVGVAGKVLEVKDGILEVPEDVENSPEWARLHAELTMHPDYSIKPHKTEKAK